MAMAGWKSSGHWNSERSISVVVGDLGSVDEGVRGAADTPGWRPLREGKTEGETGLRGRK